MCAIMTPVSIYRYDYSMKTLYRHLRVLDLQYIRFRRLSTKKLDRPWIKLDITRIQPTVRVSIRLEPKP